MKTLAIDTSLARGGVAGLDGERIAVRHFAAAADHARLLAAALDEVAAELGWRPRDVELVAVIRGPGSFTGLRVGITTAKAVAWAAAARLVGASLFEVLAWRIARKIGPATGPVAIALDAGRGEVFAADAWPAADAVTGWTVGAARIVAARDWLAGLPPGTTVTGPALTMLQAAGDPAARRGDLVFAPEGVRQPCAAAVGAVARLYAAAGLTHDPLSLTPDYLRPSYADEQAGRDVDGKSPRGG
jgi:tRNA threonylcarbamoyladenosine biosynthesis protein TsaB